MARLAEDTTQDPFTPFIDLPLLVTGAIRGEEQSADCLPALTTILFLGIDLLDDLADHDLSPDWKGYTESEINLFALTLLSTLPSLILSEFAVSPEKQWRLQKRLARGLLRMSEGQSQDLAMTGSPRVGLEEVESSLVGKSGAEAAIFAALAAEMAGANPEEIKNYEEMGCFLGVASQLASDCYDLFQAPFSRDLKNGTRTFPIAYCLGKKGGKDRLEFLKILEQGMSDLSLHEQIRRFLHQTGALRFSAFIVELYCQRALRSLEKARPLEPAAHYLREVIHAISFFHQPKEVMS